MLVTALSLGAIRFGVGTLSLLVFLLTGKTIPVDDVTWVGLFGLVVAGYMGARSAMFGWF